MNKSQVVSQNRENVSIGMSQRGYGITYFSLIDFRKGEVVMSGHGRIIDHQTPHISVQIGSDKHYLPTKWTGMYWNHSCEPNTYVKTRGDGFPDLVALRNIKKNEEINYAYWMTEFSWIKNADEMKVTCCCGAKTCRGKICSFSELSREAQEELKRERLCSRYLFEIS